MLKELNAIAGGLLGLHGYPTQPFFRAGMFGTGSTSDESKRPPAARPQLTNKATPSHRETAAFEASARGHVYW